MKNAKYFRSYGLIPFVRLILFSMYVDFIHLLILNFHASAGDYHSIFADFPCLGNNLIHFFIPYIHVLLVFLSFTFDSSVTIYLVLNNCFVSLHDLFNKSVDEVSALHCFEDGGFSKDFSISGRLGES